MAGLKVLIVNATLATLTGTETYVRDLALGLLHKGHTPIVYAPDLGPLAQELHRRTVPVVDNLNRVGTVPDIIHGNHNSGFKVEAFTPAPMTSSSMPACLHASRTALRCVQ